MTLHLVRFLECLRALFISILLTCGDATRKDLPQNCLQVASSPHVSRDCRLSFVSSTFIRSAKSNMGSLSPLILNSCLSPKRSGTQSRIIVVFELFLLLWQLAFFEGSCNLIYLSPFAILESRTSKASVVSLLNNAGVMTS